MANDGAPGRDAPSPPPPKPSVGRIVHWYKDLSAENPLPMLITHVHSDEVVSGIVSDAFGPSLPRQARSVEMNPSTELHPRWEWPARV